MNPPQSFLDTSAAMKPSLGGQVNSPIVIGQGGQAVIVAHGSDGGDDLAAGMGWVATESVTAAIAAISSAVTTAGSSPVSYYADFGGNDGCLNGRDELECNVHLKRPDECEPRDYTYEQRKSDHNRHDRPGNHHSERNNLVHIVFSPYVNLIVIHNLSQHLLRIIFRIRHFLGYSFRFSLRLCDPSASGADTPHPFTHSTLFIFLIILGLLIIVALPATTISWLIRRSLLPCCGHDGTDDDDGLVDLVQSFHTPSRSSTIRRVDENDPEHALKRRSSAFASDPRRSPFLNSGMEDVPWAGQVTASALAPSIAVPALAHLYGETGALEVRNVHRRRLGLEVSMSMSTNLSMEEHGTRGRLSRAPHQGFLALKMSSGLRFRSNADES